MPTPDLTPGDSSPWQVGDLALCVAEGKITEGEFTEREYPRKGHIGRVLDIAVHPIHIRVKGNIQDTLCLRVDGCGDNGRIGPYWGHYRFVKIPPHSMDEEDRTTIDLYRDCPVRSPKKEVA